MRASEPAEPALSESKGEIASAAEGSQNWCPGAGTRDLSPSEPLVNSGGGNCKLQPNKSSMLMRVLCRPVLPSSVHYC
jgi:hypothetical protein